MKKAFTMIELIFVIVIIGILAAVAIPKFSSTTEEAHKSIASSFVDTLNKTVGPTMYVHALGSGHSDGDITSGGGAECGNIAAYIDLPKDSTISVDCALAFSNPTPSTQPVFTSGTATETPRWSEPIW